MHWHAEIMGGPSPGNGKSFLGLGRRVKQELNNGLYANAYDLMRAEELPWYR